MIDICSPSRANSWCTQTRCCFSLRKWWKYQTIFR